MKVIVKICCLLFLLPDVLCSQSLYDDFETRSGIIYRGTGLFRDTLNPLAKGLNISGHIAKYYKSERPEDVINVRPNRKINDVTAYVKSEKRMHMYFYSSLPGMEINITLLDSTKVRRKKPDSGKHSEFQAITKRSKQWEIIYFDFLTIIDPNVLPHNINKIVISIQPGKNVPSVYYFDEFYGPDFVGMETIAR